MKLHNRDIPELFRVHTPLGFKVSERNNHEYLVVTSLCCSNGHNLITEQVMIQGEPSIKLDVTIGRRSGLEFVDAFRGSHAKLFNFFPEKIDDHAFVSARCPKCGVPLMESFHCREPECSSEQGIVYTLLCIGSRVHVCAAMNCPSHELEAVDLPYEPHDMIIRVSHINFFGEGAEDMFGDY